MDPRDVRVARSGARTREALLDAAEELFSRGGYTAVGTRELCARAGANLSAVGYHFGGKRELYLETVRRVMQRSGALDVWSALDPVPTTREGAAVALVRLVRRMFGQLSGRRELSSCARLMLHEAMRPSEALEDVVSSFARPNVERLVALLAVLSPGTPPREQRYEARSVLAGPFHYMLMRPVVEQSEGLDLSDATAVREVADAVARFALRGLRCEEPLVLRALSAPDAPDAPAAPAVPPDRTAVPRAEPPGAPPESSSEERSR